MEDRSKKDEVERGKHMKDFPSPVDHKTSKTLLLHAGHCNILMVNWHLTGGETETQRSSDMSQ